MLLRRVSFHKRLPSAISLALFPPASFTPFGRVKSLALTFPAPQGLQGLQALRAPQGLQGLQAFLAAQGLQGLQAPQADFFTAQGLQGLQAFLAPQGLHALATSDVRLAAHGLAGLAATATRAGAVTDTMPPRIAA